MHPNNHHREDYRLYFMACMWIASKFFHNKAVHELDKHETYSYQQKKEAELRVLDVLEWKLYIHKESYDDFRRHVLLRIDKK